MSGRRVVGKIIPGSMRIQVIEYALVTAECCSCGHQQETFPRNRMARCKGCGRQMVLHQDAEVENVVPIRRRA